MIFAHVDLIRKMVARGSFAELYPHEIIRLLDEREALLTTLKEMEAQHRRAREGNALPPCECETEEQVHAAIAKAEAP